MGNVCIYYLFFHPGESPPVFAEITSDLSKLSGEVHRFAFDIVFSQLKNFLSAVSAMEVSWRLVLRCWFTHWCCDKLKNGVLEVSLSMVLWMWVQEWCWICWFSFTILLLDSCIDIMMDVPLLTHARSF